MNAVLDTNAVIYLQKGLLAQPLPVGRYAISVITEMELLSFSGLTDEQHAWLQRFIDSMVVVGIDAEVKRVAIQLRRTQGLKLPDAIIAATAISREAVLFSNDRAFSGIPGLDWRELVLRG